MPTNNNTASLPSFWRRLPTWGRVLAVIALSELLIDAALLVWLSYF